MRSEIERLKSDIKRLKPEGRLICRVHDKLGGKVIEEKDCGPSGSSRNCYWDADLQDMKLI